jgi:hypothetical protein
VAQKKIMDTQLKQHICWGMKLETFATGNEDGVHWFNDAPIVGFYDNGDIIVMSFFDSLVREYIADPANMENWYKIYDLISDRLEIGAYAVLGTRP